MDRDTVRLTLLVVGLLVIAGIYVWGRYKQKLLDFLHRRGEFDEFGAEEPPESASASGEEESFESLAYSGRREPTVRDYRFDDEPDEGSRDFGEPRPAASPKPRAEPEPEPQKTNSIGAPFIIQLSVVAGRGRVFHGPELRDALLDLDLIHGEMGIFHRYDSQFRQALFSVASLVEPGTFPMNDMEYFECPGVVLFFQAGRVADPLAVYDDLINTSQELAQRLGGIRWDENRQPLTREKIAYIRELLEDAVDPS